jgi:hypothetical protein
VSVQEKLRGYQVRVRAANLVLARADAALQADTDQRERNGGPWGEDDTYHRLNAAAWEAKIRRDAVVALQDPEQVVAKAQRAIGRALARHRQQRGDW